MAYPSPLRGVGDGSVRIPENAASPTGDGAQSDAAAEAVGGVPRERVNPEQAPPPPPGGPPE